ncbi:MAG: heavy-metal-associated domain-containing protein [Longimicrobiales bacterium]
MSWKHWTAVLVVIGVGIVLQIPKDDGETMEEHALTPGGAASGVESSAVPAAESAGPWRTMVLEVTGMTCPTCETTARVAVQRIEGVRDAEFAYPEARGVVTYDTTLTSDAEIIAELKRATGYVAAVRKDDRSGGR